MAGAVSSISSRTSDLIKSLTSQKNKAVSKQIHSNVARLRLWWNRIKLNRIRFKKNVIECWETGELQRSGVDDFVIFPPLQFVNLDIHMPRSISRHPRPMWQHGAEAKRPQRIFTRPRWLDLFSVEGGTFQHFYPSDATLPLFFFVLFLKSPGGTCVVSFRPFKGSMLRRRLLLSTSLSSIRVHLSPTGGT